MMSSRRGRTRNLALQVRLLRFETRADGLTRRLQRTKGVSPETRQLQVELALC